MQFSFNRWQANVQNTNHDIYLAIRPQWPGWYNHINTPAVDTRRRLWLVASVASVDHVTGWRRQLCSWRWPGGPGTPTAVEDEPPSAQFRLVQTGNTFEGIEPEPANCGVVTHLSLEQPLTLPVLVIAPPPATPTTAAQVQPAIKFRKTNTKYFFPVSYQIFSTNSFLPTWQGAQRWKSSKQRGVLKIYVTRRWILLLPVFR